MPYETGTASNHDDLFDKLRTFLKLPTGSGGPGWTELQYEGGNPKRMFLRAPGLSGTEEIHIGFRKYEDIPGDTFGIYGWMSRSYDAGLDMQSQPGDSGDRYHILWDQTMPYWFFANGQRVMFVTKVSTTYWGSYLGKFLQYGTSGEYGQPYYLGMNWNGPVRFSTLHEGVRNGWDPGDYGIMLNPNGSWYQVRNFYENSGEAWNNGPNYIYPYASGYSSTHGRFRELRENIDGSYPAMPLILMGDSPASDIYGELDGVFATSGFSTASEDTLTIGADTYRIFQNGFRTSRYHYAALKQA